MLKLIFFLLAVFSLTGCGTFGNKYNNLEVKETNVVSIKIHKDLLKPCIPEKPISKEEYLKFLPYERELYLTNYSSNLLLTIKDCNVKLKKIKELQDKQ